MKFKVGDSAVVNVKHDKLDKWNGLKVTIVVADGTDWVSCQPLTNRPDNYGMSPFMWPVADLEPTQGVKDFLGRWICPGDQIVYPGRYSSSLFLNKGKVLAINTKTKNQYNWKTKTTEPIECFTLTVEREGTKWVYDHATKTGEHVPVKRKVTVERIERVIVVNE